MKLSVLVFTTVFVFCGTTLLATPIEEIPSYENKDCLEWFVETIQSSDFGQSLIDMNEQTRADIFASLSVKKSTSSAKIVEFLSNHKMQIKKLSLTTKKPVQILTVNLDSCSPVLFTKWSGKATIMIAVRTAKTMDTAGIRANSSPVIFQIKRVQKTRTKHCRVTMALGYGAEIVSGLVFSVHKLASKRMVDLKTPIESPEQLILHGKDFKVSKDRPNKGLTRQIDEE